MNLRIIYCNERSKTWRYTDSQRVVLPALFAVAHLRFAASEIRLLPKYLRPNIFGSFFDYVAAFPVYEFVAVESSESHSIQPREPVSTRLEVLNRWAGRTKP